MRWHGPVMTPTLTNLDWQLGEVVLEWEGKNEGNNFHYRKWWWRFLLNNDINLNLPVELVFVHTFGASEVFLDFLDAAIGESERSQSIIWKVQLKAYSPLPLLVLSCKGCITLGRRDVIMTILLGSKAILKQIGRGVKSQQWTRFVVDWLPWVLRQSETKARPALPK